VRGTVYDSVARAPLVAAQVQLVDAATRTREYTAVTDSLGNFYIEAIPPGQYIAGFFHSSVDLLGIESPLRSVTITAGTTNTVDLGIPAGSRILTSLCGTRSRADSTGAIAGVVRDADSDLPIAGATVAVSWLEVLIQRGRLVPQAHRVSATTDADGGYRVCGLRGADTLFVNAEMHDVASGVVSVAIPADGIARQDFSLGDSASVTSLVTDSSGNAELRRETTVLRGSARLAGLVTGLDGKPLADARIVVRGTGLEAKTGTDGHFTLAGLPAGTFSVEARAIGLEPRVVAVKLSTVAPASVAIRLTKPVQELSRVLVFGKIPKTRQDLLDFQQRRMKGLGHYFTQDDPFLNRAVEVSNVLTMVPGVRVLSTGRFGHVVVIHGGCPADIYIDGIKVNTAFEDVDDIPPNQIAGIEIYAGALEAPARLPSPSGCGVVALWMKH
jgi:hypothetical protein